MMCYRDKTFCTFSRDCIKEHTCHRAYTKEIEAQHRAWEEDNGALPICQFQNAPECHMTEEEAEFMGLWCKVNAMDKLAGFALKDIYERWGDTERFLCSPYLCNCFVFSTDRLGSHFWDNVHKELAWTYGT